MLLTESGSRIRNRSTKELNAKGIRKVFETVRSFYSIRDYEERNTPKRGARTFSYVSLATLCTYLEIMGLTYRGDISENKLEAMGFPRRREGRGFLRPSPARISHFIKSEWPEMEKAVGREFVDAVLRSLGTKEFTVDSTPMEASRYSRRYGYSPHYSIRMGKCHIIMCNGYPLVSTFTDANASDCGELPKLLDMLPDGIAGTAAFLSDGAYPSFENYSAVFAKFGIVMFSNPSSVSVFHGKRTWAHLQNLHASFWRKDPAFRPKAVPSAKIRYLIRNGKGREAGEFLRNLDMMRGRRLSAEYSRRRHVCECVHKAMKRWMCFDVRGLRRESENQRKSFKFFTAQVLSAIFDPYLVPEDR